MTEYRFTCMACLVAFATPDQQRSHYKADWHRYNLKRKVADLPPVTAEEFAERTTSREAADLAAAKSATLEYSCTLCRKVYANENAYRDHTQSKKHKAKVAEASTKLRGGAAIDESSPVLVTRKHKGTAGAAAAVLETGARESGVDPSTSPTPVVFSNDESQRTEEHPVPAPTSSEDLDALMDRRIRDAPKLNVTDCLFCKTQSDSIELNVDHMATAHSFFIPDLEFLVDLPGLLTYLGEKLSVGHACLWCYAPYAAGRTESHTRGLFGSLADVRRHMIDCGHTKLAYEDGADLEVADYYDFASTWVDVGEELMDESDGTDIPSGSAKEGGSGMVVDENTMQLVLPSGKALGHRDLRRYYRQTLHRSDDGVDEDMMQVDIAAAKNSASMRALSKRYAALGAKAYHVMREEERVTRGAEQARLYSDMRLGGKANKLQTYFRAQVMF